MLESEKSKPNLPEVFYGGDVDHPARHVVPILFGVQLLIPEGQKNDLKGCGFQTYQSNVRREGKKTSTTTRK